MSDKDKTEPSGSGDPAAPESNPWVPGGKAPAARVPAEKNPEEAKKEAPASAKKPDPVVPSPAANPASGPAAKPHAQTPTPVAAVSAGAAPSAAGKPSPEKPKGPLIPAPVAEGLKNLKTQIKTQINTTGKTAVKKHKFAAMAVFFVVAGGIMWGAAKLWDRFQEKDDGSFDGGGSDTLAVNVMEVKQENFQDTLVAVGNLAGGSEVPLRFEVEGSLEYFPFREGDKVQRGAVIARLRQQDAHLKWKRAELELNQYERLYAIGGVARPRLEEARLAAALARSELDKTTIRATKDGILGDKDAEVGEFVTPNKRIATLVNIETMVLRVGIIEKEIDKVFPGQKVVLTVDTYPGVEFTGKVEQISPIVTGQSRTLTVEARLDNEGGLLLPGMFARTRISVFEEANAMVVPNEAVEKMAEGGHRVYVVNKENHAEARAVEAGYISNQFTQIAKGLTPGELVITQRPQDLKDGAAVKVIEVQK